MLLTKLRGWLSLALMTSAFILTNGSAAANNETVVKEELQRKYPDLKVESVAKTPLAGIYELFSAGEIYYVDAEVKFLIVKGSMIDITKRTDLTEERLRVLTAINFDELPLDLAFRIVRGNGKRKMAYFSDPNCPYCKRLDQTLATLNDVTVHVFLYPILGADSYEKAKSVWCSSDRAQVYTDMMLKGRQPKVPTGACNAQIEKIVAFGQQKGITGTPTLFFANGQRVAGAIPAEQLNAMLDGVR